MSNLYNILKSIIEKLNTLVRSVNGVKPDKSGNVDLPQPDWSQNDPEAGDYVKNRIVYLNVSENHVINSEPITKANGTCVIGFQPEAGKTYNVTWNGQRYTCTARSFYFSQASSTVIVIGATPSGPFSSDSNPDDVPFSIFQVFRNAAPSYEIKGDIADDPNIYVEEFTNRVVDAKQLPEECVPYKQADWNETDTTAPEFINNKPKIFNGYFTPIVKKSANGTTVTFDTKANYIKGMIFFYVESEVNNADLTLTGSKSNNTLSLKTNTLYVLVAADKDSPGWRLVNNHIAYKISGTLTITSANKLSRLDLYSCYQNFE